jgi:hypothetical protein
VTFAPLPTRAQFLNVIESVFSGMARAIIHNSDYLSVKEAMSAIDLYFVDVDILGNGKTTSLVIRRTSLQSLPGLVSEVHACQPLAAADSYRTLLYCGAGFCLVFLQAGHLWGHFVHG